MNNADKSSMNELSNLPRINPDMPKASLFKDIELTGEEQDKLLWYLSFLRYKAVNPTMTDPVLGLDDVGLREPID